MPHNQAYEPRWQPFPRRRVQQRIIHDRTVYVHFYGIDTGTEYVVAVFFEWVKPGMIPGDNYGHWDLKEVRDVNIGWMSKADKAGYRAAGNEGVIDDIAREVLDDE